MFVIARFTDDAVREWTFVLEYKPTIDKIYVHMEDVLGLHYGNFKADSYGQFVGKLSLKPTDRQHLQDDEVPIRTVLKGVQRTANDPVFNQTYLEDLIRE